MIRLIKWLKPYSLYLFLAFLVLMVIASSIPNIPNARIQMKEDRVFRLDYAIHFAEYSILTGLLLLYLVSPRFEFRRKRLWWGILVCLGVAGLDEWHQLLIEGRTFNPVDLLFNVLGIASAVFICYLLFSRIHQQIIQQS